MSFFNRVKNFVKRWLRGWRLVGLIIFLLLVFLISYGRYKASHDTSNILTDIVKKQDIKQTVLATGVVTSSTDLNLSFKASGIVRKVNVKVGDKVKSGDVLVSLDQKDQNAALTSARGSLAAAEANFDKILSGASNEEVAVAQAAVDAAQASLTTTRNQQQVLVNNAQTALLNSTLSATPSSSNSGSATITVSGSYNSTIQGSYKISIFQGGDGLHFGYTGLESGNGFVLTNAPIAIGTRGLYIQFSSTDMSSSNIWTIEIPNTKASNYVTNLNAYNAALQTQASAVSAAQSTLDQSTATLNLKKAEARPADLEAAHAQILSAQGQVQAAQAGLENTIIRAPADGTITKVDAKIGELINSFSEAVVLQNISQLHLEANISEANVAQIKQDQTVDVTFDAFGPDKHYTAKVTNLDLSSTVVAGVVNYKVTASLDNADDVRPGMTANMTILTDQKAGVIAVPQRAIIDNNGNKTIRVVTDDKTKAYKEVSVQLGIYADGGLVEITSGLGENQEIITFINKK